MEVDCQWVWLEGVAQGVVGCRWWCLIANVVEGVAYGVDRVSPASPIGL